MYEELVTLLIGIFVTLIIVFIGAIIYKKKKNSQVNRYQSQPQIPQQPQQVPQYPPQYKIAPSYKNNEMVIPKKSQFNIPASVRSFTTTERDSVIVGIEVNDIDKLDLNQPIAIIGEEIIQEELTSPETNPQKTPGPYSGMEQKLEELIGLIKTEKVNGLDEKADYDESNPQPKNDSVIKPTKSKKEYHEVECSVCHVKRKTAWKPENPEDKFVCYECKKKSGYYEKGDVNGSG